MNEVYQPIYDQGVYSPIYLPAIIFYDEEEDDGCDEAQA